MTDDELTETAAERLIMLFVMLVVSGLMVLAVSVAHTDRTETIQESGPKMGHAHRLDVPNAPADMAAALRGKAV